MISFLLNDSTMVLSQRRRRQKQHSENSSNVLSLCLQGFRADGKSKSKKKTYFTQERRFHLDIMVILFPTLNQLKIARKTYPQSLTNSIFQVFFVNKTSSYLLLTYDIPVFLFPALKTANN